MTSPLPGPITGLEGQTALVTGAGAGLGRAVALALAQAGATVTAVSIVPAELDALGSEAAARRLLIETALEDVADAARTAELATEHHARHGHLDLLVNNAGIIIVKPIEETTVEDFDRVLATNLRGVFLYCRAFAGMMRERGTGTILNVSSASGRRPFVGESVYCPSKFGLEGLTGTLALELAGSGVRVASVNPGAPMHTPMSETTYDAAARARWIDPALIAPGFVALATFAGDAISGGRFDAWRVAQGGASSGCEEELRA
jgi:NAD(P)-dependent dehydrogenase (short-subunit alcohol dehydrogenase family)